MPRDFLPAVYLADGLAVGDIEEYEPFYNCIPTPLRNGRVGVMPRDQLDADPSFTPSNTNDRGRGIFAFAGTSELYLTQDSYYYSGGNENLLATTAPGYAGNTGFNEEYSASFVEHLISGVPNMVIVNAGHTSTNASASHGSLWYVSDGTSAPSSISSANMPGNNGVSLTRGGASLDGFFFVGDINGQIHNSNLNDITTWTATDFITAERYPDNGVYIGRHSDNIIYIGTRSIEFFYNNANATGSPLSRREDISYTVGCPFPNSVYQEGDTIYFVGATRDGVIGFYRISNFTLDKLSNLNIEDRFRSQSWARVSYDYDISELDALQHRIWTSGGCLNGVSGIFVTYNFFFTFFYCKVLNTWARVSYDASVTYVGGATTGWNNVLPISGFDGQLSSLGASKMQLINGTIVTSSAADNDNLSDLDANDPDVYLTFPVWDGGTDKKKRITCVRVITDSAASNSTASDPLTVQLRWRDIDETYNVATSDYYNTGRPTNLNIRSAKITRLGTTRARKFRIDYTTGHGKQAPIEGLEIEYEIVE